MNKRSQDLVSKYEEKNDFTRALLTPELIEIVMTEVGFCLPEQYVDYLNLYGHGGIAGVEILGIDFSGRSVFVEVIKDYRKQGLLDNLAVLEKLR